MGDETAGDMASMSADTDAMLRGRGKLCPAPSLPLEWSRRPLTEGWRRMEPGRVTVTCGVDVLRNWDGGDSECPPLLRSLGA